MSIEERAKALNLGGGAELGLGLGANATATPFSSAPSDGQPARMGEVEAEGVVAGFKPQYAASGEGSSVKERSEGEGSVLASGWLKKTGKGLKAKVFEPCFVTLVSDPMLLFHADEKQTTEKGFPLELTGATARREDETVVVTTPAEAVAGMASKRLNQLKLQAETPLDADLWVSRIEAAVAGKPQPAPE